MHDHLNVLLITLDDMNYNSHEFLKPGAEPLTPNMDALRKKGFSFQNSHVTIAVCQPSRSVLMTGRYPHRNGARGFERISEGIPTLSGILRDHGYYVGIIGKETHLAPKEAFFWDEYISTYTPENSYGRNAESYFRYTAQFVQQAKQQNKPFFLMANSHDPHRPFANSEEELSFFGAHMPVSYQYEAESVVVPGFLPDLPEIRLEIAQYLSSVRRADEAVGRIMAALEDAGELESTVVMILSDNGMAVPFSKANCYLNSTKSPYIFLWPDHIPAGGSTKALVSTIDYLPTILDILAIPYPDGIDGKSFTHLFRDQQDSHYADIYTSFFKTAKNQITHAELHLPMRCVQDEQYAYIYNAWADGETKYTSESMAGLTYRAMERAAETDAAIAQRVALYRYRTSEELYDIQDDPNALRNLIDEDSAADVKRRLRKRMWEYMVSSGDELLMHFEKDILLKVSDDNQNNQK